MRAPNGGYQDAVPFARTGVANAGFPADLQVLQSGGQWLPADCGGAPCSTTSTPTAAEVSVDWITVGNPATGNIVARKVGADTNTAADFSVGPASFGVANP